MSRDMKKYLSLLLACICVFALLTPAASAANNLTVANMGALWDTYQPGTGNFTITENSRVFIESESEPDSDLEQTAQLIQRELAAYFGDTYFKKLVWGDIIFAQEGDIILKLSSTDGIASDGYRLNVTSETATITAADTDGLIYGANNLMKCFGITGSDQTTVSCFSGGDDPDTMERTVHLDTARKYYTPNWIYNFIRQISWMGYNALQVHVSEDGGFRADFWDEDYYKGDFQPENDFSWLSGSELQYWVKYPYNKDPDAGKHLSTKELVELCQVAKEYHIEIIPSFDSPAHMNYITWQFEQNYKDNNNYSFTYNGKTYYAKDTIGCINNSGITGESKPTSDYTNINISSDLAKAFAFSIYEDMAAFFKEYAGSSKFMIGADEVTLDQNLSLFPGYINELNKLLRSKGYTVRMFNDMISDVNEYESNIEIAYWHTPSDGCNTSDFVNNGRTIYNCIQNYTYYVLRYAHDEQNADARDPNNRQWSFYHSNEQDIYNCWSPAGVYEINDSAVTVPDRNLGGAYFLIWNDYAAMNTEIEVWNGAKDAWDAHCTYYLFDIMASNIMKMWNADVNKTVSYDNFANVRETFTWFPGFTECSKPASLPAASDALPVVDRSGLESAITSAEDYAEKLNQDDYTEGSWSSFQAALDNAKEVCNDLTATQKKIDNAVSDLNSAKENLVDISQLKALVNSLHKDNYTEDSWNTITEAWNRANNALDDADVTQEEVDAAFAALTDAKKNLVFAPIDESDDITVRKIAAFTPRGKQIGLVVTAPADTEETDLVVKLDGVEVEPSRLISDEQTVNGVLSRIWLVNIHADESVALGDHRIIVTIDGVGDKLVEVTVR